MTPARPEPDIADLFPTGVQAGAARAEAALSPGSPFLVEEQAVERAIASRRAEFFAGRELARRLMARLDVAPCAIPVGKRRAPVWPVGVIGSIAHSHGMCVAAVARQPTFPSLGIDIEPAEAIEEALWPTICTERELRDTRGDAAMPPGLRVRMIFSAKEAVFKALYPLCAVELEFDQVSIEWKGPDQAFAPAFHEVPEDVAGLGRRLHGVTRVRDAWIITAAWPEP